MNFAHKELLWLLLGLILVVAILDLIFTPAIVPVRSLFAEGIAVPALRTLTDFCPATTFHSMPANSRIDVTMIVLHSFSINLKSLLRGELCWERDIWRQGQEAAFTTGRILTRSL